MLQVPFVQKKSSAGFLISSLFKPTDPGWIVIVELKKALCKHWQFAWHDIQAKLARLGLEGEAKKGTYSLNVQFILRGGSGGYWKGFFSRVFVTKASYFWYHLGLVAYIEGKQLLIYLNPSSLLPLWGDILPKALFLIFEMGNLRRIMWETKLWIREWNKAFQSSNILSLLHVIFQWD